MERTHASFILISFLVNLPLRINLTALASDSLPSWSLVPCQSHSRATELAVPQGIVAAAIFVRGQTTLKSHVARAALPVVGLSACVHLSNEEDRRTIFVVNKMDGKRSSTYLTSVATPEQITFLLLEKFLHNCDKSTS